MPQPQFIGKLRAVGIGRDDRVRNQRIPGIRVSFGIELNAVGADFLRPARVLRFRIHEEAHAAAVGFGFLDNGHKLCTHIRIRKIKAVIRRFLPHGIRHERCLMRTDFAKQRHQIFERIPFNIEFPPRVFLHEIAQGLQVAYADMAFIRTRMDGKSRCACFERNAAEKDRIGPVAFTGIADKRDLVQIDGKLSADHKRGTPEQIKAEWPPSEAFRQR